MLLGGLSIVPLLILGLAASQAALAKGGGEGGGPIH
jgi:hypothetical protein